MPANLKNIPEWHSLKYEYLNNYLKSKIMICPVVQEIYEKRFHLLDFKMRFSLFSGWKIWMKSRYIVAEENILK